MSNKRLTADQARNRTKEAKDKLKDDHPAVELFLSTIYEHIGNTSDQGESFLIISHTKIMEDSLANDFVGIPDTIQQSISSQLKEDGYAVRTNPQGFKIGWGEVTNKSVRRVHSF